MNTASEREAALRRALLSAAEQIEPSPGGLERIQARLGRPRPAAVAWLEAAWMDLVMRAPVIVDAVRRQAGNLLRLVSDRFDPGGKLAPGLKRLGRLHPLVAMSVAVFVLGAGIYVAFLSPVNGLFQQPGVSTGLLGGQSGASPSGPTGGDHGSPDGKGSRAGYPTAPTAHGSSSACPTSTPRLKAPPPSTSPPSQSTTPATTTTTTPSSTSSSPTASVTPTPNPGSSSPSSVGSAASPDAGLPSGNPALAGANAGASAGTTHSARRGAEGASASQSGAPSPATTGKSQPSSNSPKYNPCPTNSSHAKHHTTSPTSTSAKLTQTQPGREVAAQLD